MNPFNKTFEPGAISTRKTQYPTKATRVAAHSESASNDLSPVNASTKAKSFGKIGIRGDGQQA